MKTKTKPTPGPWTINLRQPGNMLTVEGASIDEYVCSLLGGDEYKQANARLIAAAPDLLAALKRIATDHYDAEGATIIARAALAKCEPQAPSVDGPNCLEADEILGKSHYSQHP